MKHTAALILAGSGYALGAELSIEVAPFTGATGISLFQKEVSKAQFARLPEKGAAVFKRLPPGRYTGIVMYSSKGVLPYNVEWIESFEVAVRDGKNKFKVAVPEQALDLLLDFGENGPPRIGESRKISVLQIQRYKDGKLDPHFQQYDWLVNYGEKPQTKYRGGLLAAKPGRYRMSVLTGSQLEPKSVLPTDVDVTAEDVAKGELVVKFDKPK